MYCLFCASEEGYVRYFLADSEGYVLKYCFAPANAIVFENKGDAYLFVLMLQTLGYSLEAFSVVEVSHEL